jgi:hypothetical protein
MRQFVYGLLLCFLATLLAVGAKAAWVADAGGSPTDLSAVKLCPPLGKHLAAAISPDLRSAPKLADSMDSSADHRADPIATLRRLCDCDPRVSPSIAPALFSSTSLFRRPPPSL